MKVRLTKREQEHFIKIGVSEKFIDEFGLKKIDDEFEVVKEFDLRYGDVLQHTREDGLTRNVVMNMIDVVED